MTHDHPVPATAVKNDPTALAFLRTVAIVLHTWDDLIDKDHVINDDDVNRAFTLALIDLPRNAFYRQFFEDLNPILLNAITNWRIATELERQEQPSPTDLKIAFIIRSAYVDLLTTSAALIGGKEWAVDQGVAIRRWAHAEGFTMYQANLVAERSARESRRTNHVL